jgi:prolyl oligopeptidase
MKARPIQKTIGGVTFEDRFAHLQEDSAEALAWQWERDAQAQAVAQASPNYQPVRDRLLELAGTPGPTPRKRGALWFCVVDEGDDQVVRASETPGGPGRTIVSRRALSEANGGGMILIGRMVPSPEGRYVAIVYGVNGDMTGNWAVYEAANGRHILDAGGIMYTGALAGWLPDESGFWLNDRTAEGQHRLRFVAVAEGTTDRAEVILSEDLVPAKFSGLTPQISSDGRRALLVTEPHERVALVHLDLDTLEATPFLPAGFEGECDGSWIDDETYVARINQGESRGRVVAIPAATSRDMSTWRALVPESEGFIGWAGGVAGRLYVGDMVDVSLRVRVFNFDGHFIETLPLESPGSSPSMSFDRSVRPTDAFILNHATFTRSAATFVHDPDSGELRQIGDAKHRLENCVAEQRFAISRDGTRVPYFIVHSKNLDRSRPQPALVTGYGGFNVSLLPAFRIGSVPIIEAGGIFVQTALRGGGEYGRAWHDGGRLANKANTFDDLQAVAEALIADGISSAAQMAFQGGSNGGLLAGAAITRQPHLWRAVAPVVPIFDMMEMLPIKPETASIRAIMYEDYGDTAVPEVAQSIIGWSPYHNIKDGTVYPAVYQVFGEYDVGCMPYHGRKFTARLEEANGGEEPVYLRVWRNAGHGFVDPAKDAEFQAEWLAFVMDRIGLSAAGATT